MADSEAREDIPEAVKRQVRQRCGFGCVLCGNPIIDYDHMYGYKKEVGHIAEEITLLCPEHHRDKTHKRLALETVLAAHSRPYNLHNECSTGKRLEFHGGACAIWVGNNVTTSQLQEGQGVVAIGVDGQVLLGFGVWQGRLVLTLQLFNEFNELILRIVENELRYYSLAWDIRFEGNVLTVHEAERHFLLDIEFNMPNEIRVRRARFLLNGAEIVVRRNGQVIVGNTTYGANLIWGTSGSAFILVGPGWGRGGLSKPLRLSRYRADSASSSAWQQEIAESTPVAE